MPRTLIRVAAAAVAAPLLLAGPAAAQQPSLLEMVKKALEGCYGVGVVVCDPYVSGSPVDTEPYPVDVCTGSCTTYDVPVPGFSDDRTCVGWTDQYGTTTQRCLTPRSDS